VPRRQCTAPGTEREGQRVRHRSSTLASGEMQSSLG
jgi:hypothetical protein